MLLRANPENREWLQDLIYYMLEGGQFDYCYTFHNLEIIAVNKPFAFHGANPVPACVTMDPDTDRMALLLYHPIVSRLPFEAQIVLMQHEAIHIIDGHFSTYGLGLINMFGPMRTNVGMDLYVNQKIDIAQLENAGMCPVTIEKWGLPPDLSSFEYCELVKDLEDAGKISFPETKTYIVLPDGRVIDENGNFVDPKDLPFDPQEGSGGDSGSPFTGQWTPRPFELFDIRKKDGTKADEATRQMRSAVEAALKSAGQSWGRGFGGADHSHFVKASERQAIVPWHYYLRAMETSARQDKVVPTRHRPSRRNPLHYGRVRRYGLDVAVIIDTSGSMGDTQLRLVDPELRGLHSRGAHVYIIHCDAEVAKIEEYSPHMSLENFHGRGGTEYSDAFMSIRALSPQPGMVIGFTDGYGGIERYANVIRRERGDGWYEEFTASTPMRSPDGHETLWLLPEGCMSPEVFTDTIVPWGRAVSIPLDQQVSND